MRQRIVIGSETHTPLYVVLQQEVIKLADLSEFICSVKGLKEMIFYSFGMLAPLLSRPSLPPRFCDMLIVSSFNSCPRLAVCPESWNCLYCATWSLTVCRKHLPLRRCWSNCCHSAKPNLDCQAIARTLDQNITLAHLWGMIPEAHPHFRIDCLSTAWGSWGRRWGPTLLAWLFWWCLAKLLQRSSCKVALHWGVVGP